MKKVSISILALLISACSQNSDLTVTKTNPVDFANNSIIENSYFSQKSPGLNPELFAPGVISLNGRSEGAISFSPDLNEIFFSANNKNEETAIYFSKLESNRWTPIEKADFTEGEKDEEAQPFVSSNGKRIYFTALNSDLSYNKIWYVNRLKNSWGNAVELESPINDDQVFFPNQSANGDLYYFNISKMKTFYAAYSNGDFPKVKEVEIEPGFHHAFISPSQDYLVAAGRNKEDESRNHNDIYVLFKEQDGTWSKPINLGGAVNSYVNEKVPTITSDGKYMFFSRDEEDETANVYWVSTEVITELKTAYFEK